MIKLEQCCKDRKHPDGQHSGFQSIIYWLLSFYDTRIIKLIHGSNEMNAFPCDRLLCDNCTTLIWRVGMNYTRLHNDCTRPLRAVICLEGGMQSSRTMTVKVSELIAPGSLECYQNNAGRTSSWQQALRWGDLDGSWCIIKQWRCYRSQVMLTVYFYTYSS